MLYPLDQVIVGVILTLFKNEQMTRLEVASFLPLFIEATIAQQSKAPVSSARGRGLKFYQLLKM